jgi:hypothetical protein
MIVNLELTVRILPIVKENAKHTVLTEIPGLSQSLNHPTWR